LLLFISLLTQSGNFWIRPRMYVCNRAGTTIIDSNTGVVMNYMKIKYRSSH